MSLNAARSIGQRTDRNVNSLILPADRARHRGRAHVVAARVGADRRDPPADRALPEPRHLVDRPRRRVRRRRLPVRQRSRSSTCSGARSEGPARHRFPAVRAPRRPRAVSTAYIDGGVHEIAFLLANRFGEWRHVDAHVTDLRADRQIRGVVFNGRDVTERVRLEEELEPPGLPRRPHRSREPLAVPRPARPGARPAARSRRSVDGAARRPRPLQADQRQPRAQRRRRVAPAARERLRQRTRADDTLARLGGDEFAVLLDGADESESIAIAHRYSSSCASRCRSPTTSSCSSASIGIAIAPGRDRHERGADPARRHGHVRGQAQRRRSLRSVPARHGSRARRAGRPRARDPPGSRNAASSACTTSRRSTSRRTRSSASRRWCVGSRRPAATVMPDSVHRRRRGQRPDLHARRVRPARGVSRRPPAGDATACSASRSSRG